MSKKRGVTHISCDINKKKNLSSGSNRNRLYKYNGDYSWSGVKIERYKPSGDDWTEVVRQVIVGAHDETTKFHLRYFEISPGGYTSYEWHNHEHVVVGIRGRGRVRVGKRVLDLGYLDTIYISPRTPHRLYNPYDEPFGFFCIVNARRDRPRSIRQ